AYSFVLKANIDVANITINNTNNLFLSIIFLMNNINKTIHVTPKNVLPIILNAIWKPVATAINTSTESELFSEFISSEYFELSVVPSFAVVTNLPAESASNVLLNTKVASILSPGAIFLLAKLTLLYVLAKETVQPLFNSEWK